MSNLHSFTTTKSRKHIQPLPLRHIKVVLSKEARATLATNRRDKSHRFKIALTDAWNVLDETVKTITSSHHKSFHRVQNELCMGRGLMHYQCSKVNIWNAFYWKKCQEDNENTGTGRAILQDLVKDEDNCIEYWNLTEDDKAKLLEEYTEYKETKNTGIRISTKSKVNDVTQTLKAIENELYNLKGRTGMETILYTTCGSMDLPLRGIAFATEGIEEFMSSVMNIDNQDLASKMEGFAIQGMKGAVKNYQKRSSEVRSAIHQLITEKLQEIMNDPGAKMHWANYWRNVVQRYQVVVDGWPNNIPFDNLSKVSSALQDLEMILQKWKSGVIHWKELDDDEFQKLLKECDEKIESGEIIESHRRSRSDKGKNCTQSFDNSNSSRHKKTYKSVATIESDNDDAPDNSTSTTPSVDAALPTIPSINTTPPSSPSIDATASTLPSISNAPPNLDHIYGPATFPLTF
ncbi:hypothetical protein K503DRAFT_794132 [Rhizopogon vinicolor AM-OR11-026]|uniref:Uncharacterized protein n=1 Tax=Rhizopogon vinicolor AM-OR11-026 TaxID=1314800 RepID=A0A1B7MPP9_9AGAM|nr:hypothetical protein K503DRAFT_794132 [Rhizopogon vinicolor AM-OR11-026]